MQFSKYTQTHTGDGDREGVVEGNRCRHPRKSGRDEGEEGGDPVGQTRKRRRVNIDTTAAADEGQQARSTNIDEGLCNNRGPRRSGRTSASPVSRLIRGFRESNTH